jgi:hypothetical protein
MDDRVKALMPVIQAKDHIQNLAVVPQVNDGQRGAPLARPVQVQDGVTVLR